MSKTQLLALFLCSLIPWTIGSGMVPLLPVYAAELGAAPAVAGNYLAISFLALAAGSVGASWLSDHLRRRKTPVIVAGLVSMPALWLMGRATTMWYLTAFSATWFLLGGLAMALINVLAGLSAKKSERGRVFGLLALGQPLGSLIGGLATGPIADRWGYPTMFTVLSFFGLLWPLTGLLLTDRVAAPVRRAETVVAQKGPALGGSFTLLFVAGLAASVVTPVLILGRSLAMRDLGLPAAAISSAGAIAGAATLPLPPLLGWLSDRAGRKRCLALGYIIGTAGLLCLAGSASLWHFWVASSLVGLVMPVTLGVGSALATDVVPREAVGRAVSLFSATNWVGNVIGYASTGYAIQHLGLTSTLFIGAFLPLVAIGLLTLVRVPRREESGHGGAADSLRR